MRLWEIPWDDMIEPVEKVVRDIKNKGILIDPFNIAKYYGIDVRFITTTGDAPAFSIPSFDDSSKYTMFISKDVDRYSKKILCYHELGHLLCEGQPGVYLFDHTIDHESEFTANYFAASFLPIFSRMIITDDTTIEDANEYVSSLIIYGEREIDIL